MARASGILSGRNKQLDLVLLHLDDSDPLDRTWPARQGVRDQLLLATGRTDESGAYELDYVEVGSVDGRRSGGGSVVLQAFSEGRLQWQSPITPWRPDLVIGGQIVRPTPPLPPREFSVEGRITTCGRPAAGYFVAVHEVTQTGSGGSSACLLGPPNVRLAATGAVDADGRYRLPYSATSAPPTACAFVSSVFVEVGLSPGSADWRSEEMERRFSIRVDHDFVDGCDPDSTLIRVVNQFGQPVADAEVTATTAELGVTSSAGLLATTDLADGRLIAARKLLVERETSRADHARDSDQNWSFRCYTTSATLAHNASGNNVEIDIDAVSATAPVQELVLLPTNALVGFNLLVSVEWDATSAELLTYRDRFLETSELLYNATDGQFCIERVSVVDNARSWDSADVRIHASINQSSFATLNGVAGSSGRITMNPIDSFFPGTLLHELGHYLFGVRDEYKEASGWDPANGSARCTLASTSTNPVFADGGLKDSCLMRGARGQSMKKFCSGHSANPHVDGTAQGANDCWTDILEGFNAAAIGLPNSTWWRPRGPVTRRAIVSRLPNSGLPIGTVSAALAGTPLSFIPLRPWKPRWHVGDEQPGGACPNLVVRVVENGAPVGDVFVQLRGANGHNILQGRTRTMAGTLADGSFLDVGHLSIRGAHLGDTIRAFRNSGAATMVEGSATISDCAAVLDVELESSGFPWSMRADFDPSRNLTLGVDDVPAAPLLSAAVDGTPDASVIQLAREGASFEGTVSGGHGDQRLSVEALLVDPQGALFHSSESFAICDVSPHRPCLIRSSDGQAELDLPAGASDVLGRLALRELSTRGPHRNGWHLAAGPFELFASFGSALAREALLHLHPPGSRLEPPAPQTFSVLRRDEPGEAWQEVEISAFNADPLVVTARLTRLGMYALLERG